MFRKIIATFSTRFFIAASNLATAVILSNFTGAAGRGEQSLIITLVSFIIILTSIIGSASISYLIPRHPFITLIIPSYGWSVMIIALSYIVLPWLHLVPPVYHIHICLLTFLLAIMNTNISVLIARQRINAANFLGLLQSAIIIIMLAVGFMIIKSRTIHTYIVSLYGGYGLTMLISFLFIRKDFMTIKPVLFGEWKKAVNQLAVLGFYNQIAIFTQLLSFRLSYYLLDSSHGKEAVGIYSNAVSIAESIWLIGRSICTVQHAKIVNSDDRRYSLQLTSQLNRMNFYISLILLIILSIIPGSLYGWLFGNEFTSINRIMWTLEPGILFFGFVLVQGYYFSSTGQNHINAIASSAGLVITLILAWILIPLWDVYGAGVTSSISYGITALIIFWYYRRERKKEGFCKKL